MTDLRAWEDMLGRPVRAASPVTGGDIHAAYRLELADGTLLFAKGGVADPLARLEWEAEGLEWLRVAHAVAVPEVAAVDATWLVLSWVERAPWTADAYEALGSGLADLHRAVDTAHGWFLDDTTTPRPSFLGPIPLDNTPTTDWVQLWRDQRLTPMLRRTEQALGPAVHALVARVVDRVERLVARDVDPARLHGDLWSGNVLCDVAGRPYVFDPAVYAGHREVDLAMMRLFGGFPERVFDAYAEAWPLDAGWADRVAVYQLLPLLAHVHLFGASWVPAVERVARAVRA